MVAVPASAEPHPGRHIAEARARAFIPLGATSESTRACVRLQTDALLAISDWEVASIADQGGRASAVGRAMSALDGCGMYFDHVFGAPSSPIERELGNARPDRSSQRVFEARAAFSAQPSPTTARELRTAVERFRRS